MDCEWQFPFAFSAIDGSHLSIKCPAGDGEAMKQYHNFKNFYSIVLLALVHAKYNFIWASLGAPGNIHDSTLFQSTNIWSKIVNGEVLPEAAAQVDNIAIPPLILGDGAFAMRTWIVKPYVEAVLSEEQLQLLRAESCKDGDRGSFWKIKRTMVDSKQEM